MSNIPFRDFETAVRDISRDPRLLAFPKIGAALGAARAAITECETRTAVLLRAVDEMDGQMAALSQLLWRAGVGRDMRRFGISEETATVVRGYVQEVNGNAKNP